MEKEKLPIKLCMEKEKLPIVLFNPNRWVATWFNENSRKQEKAFYFNSVDILTNESKIAFNLALNKQKKMANMYKNEKDYSIESFAKKDNSISGKQCKKARCFLGITQKEMSIKTGLSVVSISAFENNKTTPRRSTLIKIKLFFNNKNIIFIDESDDYYHIEI